MNLSHPHPTLHESQHPEEMKQKVMTQDVLGAMIMVRHYKCHDHERYSLCEIIL
jgi:hypothetical protein